MSVKLADQAGLGQSDDRETSSEVNFILFFCLSSFNKVCFTIMMKQNNETLLSLVKERNVNSEGVQSYFSL